MQALPYQIALAQQEYALKGLDIEKARLALGIQGQFLGAMQRDLGGRETAPAAPYAGRSEGITNGPQGAVSANTSPLTPGAETGAPPSPVSAPTGGGRSSVSYGEVSPSALGARDNAMMSLSPQTQFWGDLAGYKVSDAVKQVNENTKQQAQWHAQPALNTAEAVITSHDPVALIQNNPGLAQIWTRYASRLGPDAALNPTNARRAALLAYNDIAGSVGLPPKAEPEEWRPLPGGYQQINTLTGETKGSGGVSPSLSMLDYKSLSGETGKRPVWSTFPGNYQGGAGALPAGAAATAAGTGRVPGGGARGGTAPAPAAAGAVPQGLPAGTISTGFEVSPQQRATANFAKNAFDAVRTAEQYEQKGTYFNDAARTAILDAIAPEEGGGILGKDGLVGSVAGALGTEYASRKLYKLLTTPDQRSYLAGIIPLLEARAQSLSTAATKGLSSQQIRLAFEELIPSSKNQEVEVSRNRENLVRGQSLEAGPAIANYPDVQRWLSGRQAQASKADARQNASLAEIEAELARRRGGR